jgi:hypothetical protein
MNGDPASEWRRNPHIQSYVMATDQVPPYGWCSVPLLVLCDKPAVYCSCGRFSMSPKAV